MGGRSQEETQSWQPPSERSSKACRAPIRGALQQALDQYQGKGRGCQEDDRQRQGQVEAELKSELDCQRHGLGAAREVASKDDGGAELAQGSGPGHGRTAHQG